MARRIDLNGSIVLITGAGAGIGRALTEEALRRDAHVVAIERDAEVLETLEGARLTKHCADVCDGARVHEIVAQTLADHGRLDVAIANAGIEKIDPIWAQDPKAFEAVINVNVLGVYRTLQPCLAPIIASGGHLCAMSSIAGIIPFPFGAA
ncbi:SDR family NAD(P)-dependent oxidoreductase, partial [Cognatishimia sp.]|uniref:SDR family NAD(P)-dependent oxidoreductase n=1 Tax=Cognatishimia sp. TaxID=2211648 RepID=UPI0035127982|nr:SDR family NAD(P)-dependent oxidoreductase [Cognatishimia sp.]